MDDTSFVTLDTALETGAVERRELAGREHLVAPVVLVREMVLNGGYLPADEMARSVPGWNGVPVTVGHPQVDGQHVSANNPEFFDEGIIGRIFAAEFTDDLPETDRASGAGIRGEAWVDEQRALAQGGDAAEIAEFLAAHADADLDDEDGADAENQDDHVMDVSTGYFHELTDDTGEFAGQEFEHVQLNLHPDHLAFLPDQEGACSVADGCGVPRVQARLDGEVGEAADVIADRVSGKLAEDGLQVVTANSTDAAADGCGCEHESNMTDNIDIEELAELAPFSADELDEMDDEKVASLHEAFTEADADEAEAAAEADEAEAEAETAEAEAAEAENETDADELIDRVEALMDEKFEAFSREQRADDIESAKAVLVDDGVDEAALDALDPDTLVALAEKVEANEADADAPRGSPGVNWLGRGQPAANGEEPEDDHAEWTGQMGYLTRDPEGGD